MKLSLDGPISGNNFGGSFAATLVISADGKTLYALDQGNWRVVVIDAGRMQRVASIPTGAYPVRPCPLARRQAPLRHQHRPVRIHRRPRRQ